MPEIEDRWYWDRRNNKAYYPVDAGDETVEFRTVWHVEEVTDARESGALVPVDEIKNHRAVTPFDLKASFRFRPEEDE